VADETARDGIKTAGHEGIHAANAAVFRVISRSFHLFTVIFYAKGSVHAEND